MTKQVFRGTGERLKVRSGIGEQRFTRLADGDYA